VGICKVCGKNTGFFGPKICKECSGELRTRQIKEKEERLKHGKIIVENPQAGFTPQSLRKLSEQLKAVGRKTCLDCIFCQLREEMVERIDKTGILELFAGVPPPVELRVNLVCRKFLLDLNDKLESAENCSSFLTEKEYQEKCLEGEILGYAGIENTEMSRPKPIMASCQYCKAKYDITLYRRCPKCGAFSPESNTVNQNLQTTTTRKTE
jgi:hypothetical protein